MSAIPRNENETFEDYQARRAADARAVKKFLEGTVFHDSFNDGTYINPKRQLKKKAKRNAAQLKGSN